MTRPLQSQIDELKIGKTAQAQYGLTSVYPNDYIEWLGKYNEYWWNLLYDTSKDIYEELQTTISENKYFYDSGKQTTQAFTMPEIIIKYSKNISIDQSTGSVTLLDPQSLTIPSKSNMLGSQYQIKENEIDDLISSSIIAYAPCYCEFDDGTICYIPYGATGNSENSAGAKIGTIYTEVYRKKDSDGDFDYGWVTIKLYYSDASGQVNGALVSSELKHYESGYTEYAHSTDRNAYPDSGTVDGITYAYLGRPFEKFPTVPQIEVGSYTGTGRYGSSNPNSLTFLRKPLIVFISGTVVDTSYDAYKRLGIAVYEGSVKMMAGNSISSGYTTWSNDGKTMTWYHTEAATHQLNRPITYRYVALG